MADPVPTLPVALAALQAWLQVNVPGHVAAELVVVMYGPAGKKMVRLPWPPAIAAAMAREEEEEPEPFIPGPFQEAILTALDGKALRTDALGAAVRDRGRLFKRGGLQELRAHGLVAHHERLGFYRPDAPPPQLQPQNESG